MWWAAPQYSARLAAISAASAAEIGASRGGRIFADDISGLRWGEAVALGRHPRGSSTCRAHQKRPSSVRRSRCISRRSTRDTPICARARSPPTSPSSPRRIPTGSAICLATTDGHVYEVGDSGQPFTIQSISKPFVYGLALEDRGREAVLRRIGVEPTGDAFNAISLEPGQRSAAQPDDQRRRDRRGSLVAGRSADDKRERLLARAVDVRRSPARRRPGRLRIGARHRPSQPRDRPHAAQLRHRHRGSGAGARPLLPAVLDRRDVPRPRPDGGDARQRRR